MPTGTATRLLRLFKTPSVAAVLGLVRRGERVDIVRTVVIAGGDERWLEVDARAGRGFVKPAFVRVEGDEPPPPPEPEEPEEPDEPEPGPARPPRPSRRALSGPEWVSRFPTSRKTGSLVPDFARKCDAFIAALRDAGATVTISATLRPPERAYLMHFSFLIHSGEMNPSDVPSRPDVDIDWVHRRANGSPDIAASRAAASAMVDAYDIVHRPSLSSLHTVGQAIDMTIRWSGNLTIRRKNGTEKTIASEPRNGLNSELWVVGATYGVIKLPTDRPHWSSNGH